jgi:hemerythrin
MQGEALRWFADDGSFVVNEIDPGDPVKSKLAWSDDLTVGNRIIDDDHKAFFEIAKMLHESDGTEDRDLVVESAISILEEYVCGHFLREEKAMRSAKYPRVAAHVLQHNLFRGRIEAIGRVYRQGTKSVAVGLPDMAIDWLITHIKSDDAQYKGWIRERDVDDRPLVYLAIEAEL